MVARAAPSPRATKNDGDAEIVADGGVTEEDGSVGVVRDVGGHGGRHTRWRLDRDDRDIALCFLSGQMIYRVSPYIAASYYGPRKNT